MSLREVLVASFDGNNPNLASFHESLQERASAFPVEFTLELLAEVNDPNAPRQALFLSILLINRCFNALVIPLSEGHPFLESGFPPPVTEQCLSSTFPHLSCDDISIRNAAVDLFSSISMTQLHQEGCPILSILFGLLCSLSSVSGVLSSI